MKKQLAGYYDLPQEEFDILWQQGLIILDTNVLLNLYRSSATTRKDILDTLRFFSTRIWIPYQVRWEYQENRNNVIDEQKQAYFSLISFLEGNEKTISGKFSEYSHHPFIDIKEIQGQIKTSFHAIRADLQNLEKAHPDYSLDDPIQNKLTSLYEGKIGEKYSYDRLHEIYLEGKKRYDSKTPPGYKDENKSKKSDNELYGDLIVWYEVIDKAKSSNKPVIFVTDDNKEDWWFIKKGQKYGPRPELIEEIREKSNVLFWMYNSDRFLIYSREWLKQPVDHDTLTELREITKKEEIEETRRDQIIKIEADRDSFVIGRTVEVFGFSYTKGSYVRLMLFGPGQYSEGVEIATPNVSEQYRWRYLWDPGYSILAGTYLFVAFDPEKRISDEVTVNAEKGAITMVAFGAQSYYIGEKIKLSGTSTASKSVFLAIQISGTDRSARKLDDLSIISRDNDPLSFLELPVSSDCTWSYFWDTSSVGIYLRPGIHTLYAVEGPYSPNTVEEKAIGSVSVIIKKPYVSCSVSQPSVAQGNSVIISGMAEGVLRQKIQIWIFGDSFVHQEIVHADLDSSFLFKILGSQTKKLQAGQYYVVIHHPMLDNKFSVYLDDSHKTVLIDFPKTATPLFSTDGPGSIHGAKASEALAEAINNADTDDIYTKCQFLIQVPVIHFHPIGNKYIGDKFTISASTNLSVDSEISIEVMSSSFDPNKKNQPGKFTGATGTVKVLIGGGGLNRISFDVDSTTFLPDEYIVKAFAVSSDVTASIIFNILEKKSLFSFFRRLFP